ncbi:hypothetical protein B2H97_07010 [Paraclostridium bifermentans]|uniref:glycosyltransferase family 4 protein n=1 Tax=Paraclostridium bifermentans TaxID=1490 RepID=UPI000A16D722|nr:glycosyltransferase family 4 protein [Paraclostridium bifermentans]OSB10697.1 hypothetical protein B2H97_07010 [Paraclostridium bifermentans]
MKRILYVRNGPYKVNPSLYNLQEIGFCKELCKLGFDCDIIYYSDEDRDELIYSNNNCEINLLWRRGYKLLRTGIYPKLLKSEFVNKYDLIITTEYSQIMSLLWTRYKPKVVLYNGPYYNLFKIPPIERIYDLLFVKKINKSINKVFTKSNLSTKYLTDKGFSDVTTLGVGLDVSIFEKEYSISDDVKSIIEYMKNNKCLLYVGSLDDRKNFRFTLKVFEKINKIDSSVHLIIIGKGKEKYVKKSFEMIDESVCKNILHIQQIQNKYLKNIYTEADVFILPSKLEIFGMVLLEAMYFGAATITSKNGGSTTLIKNKKNGIIMDGFCVDDWVFEITKLLNDDEYRIKIKDNAIETIKNEFTWEHICKKFISEIN